MFDKLLSPGNIASIETRNRIVMPAMGMNMSDGGFVNEAVINHYVERAKGGVGLIVVEVTCVDAPLGLNTRNMLVIDDDKYIPDMKRLTDAIHAHGAKCVLQLSHTGRGAKSFNTGSQPVGPSDVPMPYTMVIGLEGEQPRALQVDEIRAIEDKYAAAALRAEQAGFDGVQVHATGYYLVAQFLSRTANTRRDEYGGSARKRARFALNILKKIKARTDLPVIYKLSLLELGKNGGISLLDGIRYARWLQQAGADAIEVMAMSYKQEPSLRDVPDTAQAKGLTFPLAKILKLARIRIPLIAGGRTFEPELAERGLRSCDFVWMGRGLLAEPHLPNMILDGSYKKARPCIGCGRCIDNQLQHQQRALCSGNPVLGRGDNDYSIPLADQPRKVMVIGSGPAGLEAARIAAKRGHQVSLIERESRLGGQLHYAVAPPNKQNVEPMLDYFSGQLEGVDLQLNREMSAADLLSEQPDVLICATGVRPSSLPIPGFDRTVNAKQVLAGAEVGKDVVVIGGGLVGCETAELLAEQKKRVAIVELLPELATKMVAANRTILLGHLAKLGVRSYTGCKCKEISEDSVLVEDADGNVVELKADSVIAAIGDRPETNLYDELKDKLDEVYLIGDALKPEGIAESVHAAYRLVMKI